MEKTVSDIEAISSEPGLEPEHWDMFDLLRSKVVDLLCDFGFAAANEDRRAELIIMVQQVLNLELHHRVGYRWADISLLHEKQVEQCSRQHEKLEARELAALKTSGECLDALSRKLNVDWDAHVYSACEAYINKLAMKDNPGHKMKTDAPAFREEWVAPLVHQFIVDNGLEVLA